MFLALYNFSSITCNLEGKLLENEDKSILIVYQDSAYKMAEQIIPLYEKYGNRCVEYCKGPLSFCLYDKNKRNYHQVYDNFSGPREALRISTHRLKSQMIRLLRARQKERNEAQLPHPRHRYM